jgi:hypothetical protein
MKRKRQPAKFDRCVKAVKKRGGAVSPYAVCRASLKNPGEGGYVIGGSQWVKQLSHAKREAQAVATRIGRAVGIVDHRTGKQVAVKHPKHNPASEADRAYQDFHGHPPDVDDIITEREHRHSHLPGAGKLEYLVIDAIDNKHRVTLSNFKGSLLAFNEKKNQLFVKGGDQKVRLSDFGIRNGDAHEVETLGKAIRIGYATRKDHLGREGGPGVYDHVFRTTNENGKHVTVKVARYPDVIYYVLDERLVFSGGSYKILDKGIDQ